MKVTSVFAGAVGGLVLASTSAMGSPYLGLSMQQVNDGDQGITYRLFANLEAGARVDAVYGNSQGELYIGTDNGATLYQNANGGPTSKEINSNFFPFVPSMEWDSYVSIGAYYQNGAPFGENNLNNIGINWSQFEGGGPLVTDNGSWFVTPEDAQGNELNGQVFLGQFTVQGGFGDVFDLVGQINLQGKDAAGDTWNVVGANWLYDDGPGDGDGGDPGDGDGDGGGGDPDIPAPGALALLGLAGLAGRSRRRA